MTHFSSFYSQFNHPVDVSKFETVNQTKPSENVSEKYKFIPTTKVLEVLADYGWLTTSVQEASIRHESKRGFQKHALRLSNNKLNQQLSVAGTLPQILLTNSHMGNAAFQMEIALFEKVCSNGLVVNRGSLEKIRVLHKGYANTFVEEALQKIATEIPEVLETTENLKKISLTQQEEQAFASAAIELRFDGEKYSVDPNRLLWRRHRAQREKNLWNTFNVVQENLIKGGIPQRKKNGIRIRSRKVKSIDQDIKINKALWQLTQKMAEIKQGTTMQNIA